MAGLINLISAILAGLLAYRVTLELGGSKALAIIVGVLIAVLVFFMNLAQYFL